MSRSCLGESWEFHTCVTSALISQVHPGAAKPGAQVSAKGAKHTHPQTLTAAYHNVFCTN